MNISRKIIIFLVISVMSIGGLIIKDKLNSNDEIYVLSEENSSNKEFNNEDKSTNNTDINEDKNNNDKVSNKEVTVYVSGAVKTPGVVTLKDGDRLSDAVEKVGGTTDSADLNQINMAIKVEDEKHYIIPKIGEKINNDLSTDNSNNSVTNDENKDTLKVNINSATIEELDTLPGVGEATANKIINYRNENGKFNSIEEIKNVNGIGDKKFEDLKELISV